jgi:uncharacterized protein involved in exopolysaccharide biosynthesis
MPPWYRASARLVIVPADDPTALRASNALDLATATLPMLLSVLQSERCAEAVVARLRLDEAWHLPPRKASRRLLEKLDVQSERKSNLVSVAIDERTPVRAREIVAAVTESAAAISIELWSARDREQRQRLELDRTAVAQQLDEATVGLQRFRERTHVVDLATQIKASVEQAAALERVRIDKALALRFARGYGNGVAIEVQRSAHEVAAVTRELESLRHDAARPGPLLALDRLPALEAEEARLRRNLEAAAAHFELLSQKINQLAATGARPSGRAETIDPAVVPLHRAGPSRARFAGGGALLGTLGAACFFLLRARRRRYMQLS